MNQKVFKTILLRLSCYYWKMFHEFWIISLDFLHMENVLAMVLIISANLLNIFLWY